jgi:excisionase family DNA binding protein
LSGADGDERHVAKPTLRLGRAGVAVQKKGENIVTVEAKISTSDARGKWDFEPLLDARQAATLLGGLHVKTVQRMARRGELPGYQIGKFWFFRASELSQWLMLHSSSQNNPPAQTRKEIQ